MPFIDSKFISVLLAFDPECFIKYRVYHKVYESFFPEFWKLSTHRVSSVNSSSSKILFGQNPIKKAFSNNLNDMPEFKKFWKESGKEQGRKFHIRVKTPRLQACNIDIPG